MGWDGGEEGANERTGRDIHIYIYANSQHSNGHTGDLLHLREKEKKLEKGARPPIRTQRTTLQSTLLSLTPKSSIHLSKKLSSLSPHPTTTSSLLLSFTDTTTTTAALVIGADGIRSAVRDAAFPDYELHFTGTTIWRTLLRYEEVADLDDRFGTTAWWHAPESHVYFSKVGEGRWEIAARKWEDPEGGGAEGKVSWGVDVGREVVEREFVVSSSFVKGAPDFVLFGLSDVV